MGTGGKGGFANTVQGFTFFPSTGSQHLIAGISAAGGISIKAADLAVRCRRIKE